MSSVWGGEAYRQILYSVGRRQGQTPVADPKTGSSLVSAIYRCLWRQRNGHAQPSHQEGMYGGLQRLQQQFDEPLLLCEGPDYGPAEGTGLPSSQRQR